MNLAMFSRIVLTIFSLLALTNQAYAAAKSIETVELRVTKFFGADGYIELEAVDPKGSIGNSKVSLRCVERAYDGNIAWTYQELMVLDSKGPEIKRKEPRGNVAKENGYSFVFASFEECEKASPNVLDGSADCRMRVAIDKTPIKRKFERTAKGTARLISAECVSPSKAK